jgi:hypothetical protein
MATILPTLYRIYRDIGYEPVTGHSSHHFFNFRDAPFTRFAKGSEIVGIWGLALQEIMFIEHFNEFISPRRILIVGNAHGWSTIALALIFPSAKVVAIDIDNSGVEFTNALTTHNKLSALAVTARAPDGINRVAKEHLDGLVDLCLIDAVHSNEAIIADFDAIRNVSSAESIYLFHDVVNWNMIAGFQEILRRGGMHGKIFTRTPSGMALAYSKLPEAFSLYLDCFSDRPEFFQALRQFCLNNFVDPIKSYRSVAGEVGQ